MVTMQRHIIGIMFALQIVLALSCCRIESEKEYPTVSKILQADNFNRICEIVGIDRMSAHRDMLIETYEQNSFSGIVDGLSVDVSIVEEDGKLVLLRVKIKTKVEDKEVFVNDILKNIGKYQTKIYHSGYQVIATKDSYAVISFMYEKDTDMVILVSKYN